MLVGNVGDEQPHQSLFSLLLDIETRLRAEARGDSHHPSRFAKTRRTQKEQESLPVKLNSLTRFNLRLDEGAFAQDGMVEDLADVTAVVTETHKRLVFPELRGVERASIFPKYDPHDCAMSVGSLTDSNNSRRNKCHCGAFYRWVRFSSL
jgi:hypothetical protein